MKELAIWCLIWMIILVITGGIAFVYLYNRILIVWKEVEKLKKLKEDREHGLTQKDVCEKLLSFIDTMKEEPKTEWLQELQDKLDSLSKEDFDKVMTKYSRYGEEGSIDYNKLNTMLDESLSKETKESWNERLGEEPVSMWHDASEPPIIDKTFLLVATNGNSSLCLWDGKELHSVTIGGGHSVLCRGDIYSYIDDLLNLDNSCNFGKNLQEEPASEDLKTEIDKYIKDNFTIDKEELDRLGIEEDDYMYSMDKSDMLALVEHFINWLKQKKSL